MKAYGLKSVEEWPDVADIHAQARKSSVGKPRSKGGDFRGYHKNKAAKAASRRIFKRRARREGKRLCVVEE